MSDHLVTCPMCHASKIETKKEIISFRHEGEIISDVVATRYDSTFFLILEGIYKGNLVHVFNVIN